jgi:hypothetical protein
MQPHTLLISALSVLVYFLAVWRGGAPERAAGGLLLVMFLADELLAVVIGRVQFRQFAASIFVGNLVELAGFTWLAIRANRVWPIVPAGLKLVAVLGHLAALLLPGGMQRAYWAMVEPPALLTVVALAIGLAAHLLRQRRIGPYPDWRPDLPFR